MRRPLKSSPKHLISYQRSLQLPLLNLHISTSSHPNSIFLQKQYVKQSGSIEMFGQVMPYNAFKLCPVVEGIKISLQNVFTI